jgi:histidine triad (HIT) family protein
MTLTDTADLPLQPDDCLFCRIVKGVLAISPIYQNEHVLAFADIAPQAPTHVLVIPKQHVTSLIDPAASSVLDVLMQGVQQTATHLGLSAFRTVINTGAEAGQSVFHLHVHLLAGRSFAWPPG